MRERNCRLAVVASHPIQYFTPVYRRLAAREGLDLMVFYCREFGVKPSFDRQFGRQLQWDTDQLSGYPYRFLKSVSPVTDVFNPLHAINPSVFPRLLRGYDAVWVNGYLYPTNWLAAIAARLTGARILLRSEMRLRSERRPTRVDPLRESIIRRWVRGSDALLYIGQENRDAYLAYGASPDQLFFTPYSVDVEALAPAEKRSCKAETRRRLGLPAEGVVLLFVGKLTERKHPEALVDLCHRLRHLGVHGVLAGSGPLEEELKRRAAANGGGNVTFLGFINQSGLPDVYAAADIFVFPSENEPWGLVLNEAMAAGLAPVVSSDVGSVSDLITPNETGVVFGSGRWDELAEGVERLVQDSGFRADVARAARERSLRYSYDATAAGVVDALRSLGVYSPPERAARCG